MLENYVWAHIHYLASESSLHENLSSLEKHENYEKQYASLRTNSYSLGTHQCNLRDYSHLS